MSKQGYYKFVLIAVGVFLLFIAIYSSQTYWKLYLNTLGNISTNYERVGTWDAYEIHSVKKPFVKITNDKLLQWDADIYHCISERLYRIEKQCYGQVRAAFFPLFSLVWKVLHLNPIVMSIFNYVLFALSLFVLLSLFFTSLNANHLKIYALFLAYPSAIFYLIPYSEALFLASCTLAIWADIKGKYWLYAMGVCALAMVRPATAFVFVPLGIMEAWILFSNLNKKENLVRFFKRIIPFIIGYVLVYLIQFFSSGNKNIFWDARKYWTQNIGGEFIINDWSIEGFGMSVVALTICIPLSFGTLLYLLNSIRIKGQKLVENKEFYWVLLSVLYILGIFTFTIFTSNGNLHSFSRFIFASPFFFILAFYLINKASDANYVKKFLIVLGCLSTLCIFLKMVTYGGEIWHFSYLGLFLFIAYLLYLSIYEKMSKILSNLSFSALVLSSLLWNAYLLNMFLSNAWVFT